MDVIVKKKPGKGLYIGVITLMVAGIFIWGFINLRDNLTLTLEGYSVAQTTYSSVKKTVAFAGQVVSNNVTRISSLSGGKVEKVFIQRGYRVKKDQRLLVLDTTEYLTAIESLQRQKVSLEYEIQRTELELKELEKQQEFDLLELQKQLEYYLEEFGNKQKIFDLGGITYDELANVNRNIEAIHIKISRTKELYLIKHNILELNLAEKINIRNTVLTNIEDKKERMENKEIVAPFDGTIHSIFVVEGDKIEENQVCVEMIQDGRYDLKIKIPQYEIYVISEQDQVIVRFNNNDYKGRITHISSLVQSDPVINKYVEGLVQVDDTDCDILLNMDFYVEKITEQRDNVLVIPRGDYISMSNFNYVFKVSDDGATAKKVSITVGLFDDNNIEVTSGLMEGEYIITSSYELIHNLKQVRLRKD